MVRSSQRVQVAAIALLALSLVTGLVFVSRSILNEGGGGSVTESPVFDDPRAHADRIPLAEMAVRNGGLIDLKMRLFKRHMARFPATIEELTTAPEPLATGQRWEGPYVSSPDVLKDPWGRPYQYRARGASGYDLWSAGPDGASGTADDVHN